MIKYSTYCTEKTLSKKEQRKLFKEIVDCKEQINKRKNEKLEKRLTELNNKIVCSHIPLVIKALQKYKTNQAIDSDELLHEGILGLYHALGKYDYKRNHTFATYALPWVKFKIQLASKSIYALNISPHFLKKFKKYKDIEEHLRTEVKGILEKQYPVSYISLQDPLNNEKNENINQLKDVIADLNVKLPSEMMECSDCLDYITTVIKTLDEDEQYIIRNRFGFDGDKLTLEEIGKKLNVSRERIFTQEQNILNKLKYRVKRNA